jgi:very-short-patch-repair endonuclease
MTDAERKLWHALRSRSIGAKFRRQVPLGPYVVDFVCFEPKLIVEVDGGQHLENARDIIRDKYFERQGYRVLRYWNNDVHSNLDGVLMTIASAIDPSPGVPRTGTPPSPSRGEGNSSKWPA